MMKRLMTATGRVMPVGQRGIEQAQQCADLIHAISDDIEKQALEGQKTGAANLY